MENEDGNIKEGNNNNHNVIAVVLVVIALALIVLAGLNVYSYMNQPKPTSITCAVTFSDQKTANKTGLIGYMDAMAWMTVVEKQHGAAITAFECD